MADALFLASPHFVFEYGKEQEPLVRRLWERAEGVRKRHCRLVSPCFDGTIRVQMARDEGEFLALQPEGAHIDWAAGVAYGPLALVILRVDRENMLTIEETFEHEVSHVFLLKALPQRPPRWLIEGLAIIQADQDLISRFEQVAAASASDSLLPLGELDLYFPGLAAGRALAYAQSGLFVSFLRERSGDQGLAKLIAAMGKGRSTAEAVRDVYGLSLAELEREWRAELGSLSWLAGLLDSWLLWAAMTVLFLLVVAVKLRRARARRRQLDSGDRDWEFRGPNPQS